MRWTLPSTGRPRASDAGAVAAVGDAPAGKPPGKPAPRAPDLVVRCQPAVTYLTAETSTGALTDVTLHRLPVRA
jgi:hypothetical protein